MKISKFRVISNLIIICMFIILISYIGTSNYKYVFSYNNNDVIYNGNRESNKVSIMFNVYWGTEYIEDILEVLDKYDVKNPNPPNTNIFMPILLPINKSKKNPVAKKNPLFHFIVFKQTDWVNHSIRNRRI